jgi:hypothetical protein
MITKIKKYRLSQGIGPSQFYKLESFFFTIAFLYTLTKLEKYCQYSRIKQWIQGFRGLATHAFMVK